MSTTTNGPRRAVVFAPDSFKGTVSAAEAAQLLAAGWAQVDPRVDAVLRPMADGGEGTLDAFATALPGARRMPVRVDPPPGRGDAGTLEAEWLLLPPDTGAPGGTGVVELASTAGIMLLGAELDPWGMDTRGFGQAIGAALDHGVSRLVLAIGSSGSTDGGAGMLEALGARFGGVGRVRGARGLARVAAVDLSELRPLPSGGVEVLTDVATPLLGPVGAAAVFGPQKGFRGGDIAMVDASLARYARLFDVDPATSGAGAAGGTGFGLLAWGARLRAGSARVGELIGLPAAVAAADLVVTGEGSYDAQSAAGKVPGHVASLAAAAGARVVLVCGRFEGGPLSSFPHVVSLAELAGSPEAAMRDARRYLWAAGAEMARRTS